MNSAAVPVLEELFHLIRRVHEKCDVNSWYGSWHPGRRNTPPSGVARREMEARRRDIFATNLNPMRGQIERQLFKLTRLGITPHLAFHYEPNPPLNYSPTNTTPMPDTTMPDTHTKPEAKAHGRQLDGENLQEVLDSARNADEIGRSQFFTPYLVADRLMLPLPTHRPVAVDLTGMGGGSLLRASGSDQLIGVDIDSRCARKPEGASGTWTTATADITKLYPLLCEVEWKADLLTLNHPWGLEWYADRICPFLQQSDLHTIKETLKRQRGEVIDSTLATMLIALDRLTPKGEGFVMCYEPTAIRLFGDPDAVYEGDDHSRNALRDLPGGAVRQHIWYWLTLPPGVFDGVTEFNTAVLYFARDHLGSAPFHVNATSANPDDLQKMLLPTRNQRSMLRHGRAVWSPADTNGETVNLFAAAKDEYYRRYKRKPDGKFNIYLENGRIKRHLTPFQSFSGKIPKELIQSLNDLQDRTPMELVVSRDTRTALLKAVRSKFWEVDPALVVAVDEAVAAYNSCRAPFLPMTDVQRLAFLDETDTIQCRKPMKGFEEGEFYLLSCSTEGTEREGTTTNILGDEQTVTWYGQDLVVKIRDGANKWHSFTTDPKITEGTDGTQAHPMSEIVEHFLIPEVPDVSIVHRLHFEENLRVLGEIEDEVCRRKGKPRLPTPLGSPGHNHETPHTSLATTISTDTQVFCFYRYQKDDLARFAIHDGGILGWDPGLGKTLALYAYARLKKARRILIVAPDSLHQQIIDEFADPSPLNPHGKFGVKVERLMSQDEFFASEKLQRIHMLQKNGLPVPDDEAHNGWWITSYTALGFNGADESTGKEDDMGQFIITQKMIEMRQKMEGYAPALDFGCGIVKNGIRCAYRPSLSTLTSELFDMVECDEGVRLKADDSYQALGVRRMKPQYRAVFTGTPVKNKLDDIFWLAHWAAGGSEEAMARWPYPATNAARTEFADSFMVIERNWTREAAYEERTGRSKKFEKRTPRLCNVHRLWKLLCNVVLRRRKDDIGQELAPKTIIPLRVPPGRAQQAVYQFHIENAPEFTKSGEEMNAIAALVAQLQNLRQAALCPDSTNLSSDTISLWRIKVMLEKEANGERPAPDQFDAHATSRVVKTATLGERTPFEGEAKIAFALVEKMIQGKTNIDLAKVLEAAPSLRDKLRPLIAEEMGGGMKRPKNARSWTDFNPKQAAILKLAEDLLNQGEQLVVLTPFQHFNKTLYRRLIEAGISACLLDGTVSGKKRGAMSKQFKKFKYSVLVGGLEAMGEGHSWEQCAHLVLPSIAWAYDKNRQAEDRVHRINSKRPVCIYAMETTNTIDERLSSLYREKADSSNLALNGRLFADNTEEINLGKLLSEAIRNFDPTAPCVDELDIEKEWNESLRHKLGVAERRFREWHPPVWNDDTHEKVTPKQVEKAATLAGLGIMVTIAKAVPNATYGALLQSQDPAVIAHVKGEFLKFIDTGKFTDWRRAWAAFDSNRPKVVSPAMLAARAAMAAMKSMQ